MPAIIDAILLFTLSVPVVMKYRILPVEGTPYWLFGLLFAALVANVLLAYRSMVTMKSNQMVERTRDFLIWFVLVVVVGSTVVTAMVDRSRVAPVWGVHDIILQQEAAIRYLIVGKNPYKETYFGTPVESFNYDEPGNTNAVNPALYHFVMPPWYLLFPFIFYFFGIKVFGFFDGRMALLFCMAGILGLLWRWVKQKSLARLAVTVVALSPSVIDYFIEGRSDTFAFFWLLAALFLLQNKKLGLASAIFGLAVMSKQTIWIAVPFFAVYIFSITIKDRRRMWKSFVSASLVVIALAVPFLVWDGRAFIDSVILYLSGGTAGSYPVSGYGLGMVLYSSGIIRDIHAAYPFFFWQAGFGVPVLIILLRWVWRRPTISTFLFGYGTFLAVFWYMSRYFNNSHIGYISLVFFVAGILFLNEAKESVT